MGRYNKIEHDDKSRCKMHRDLSYVLKVVGINGFLREKTEIHTRKQNSLTQIEFAQQIGVSQGTLSDLEKDKCKPSVDTLISLRPS